MSLEQNPITSNVDETAPLSEVSLPPVHNLTDVRGIALTVIATITVVYALNWAQSFVISLLLGILFAYTLNPLVIWLEKLRIPRVVGTTLVMASVISALIFGAYSLREEVQTILDQLPTAANKLSDGLSALRAGPRSTMQKVQKAAIALESATIEAAGAAAVQNKRVTHVVIDTPTFKLRDMLWNGSVSALGIMSQALMVVFLVFFLLVGGDTFKRKLVRLTGPPLSRKKITVNILDDINSSIQRYMIMLLVTNALVVLVSWVVFRIIGLENAGVWATASGILHVVPYFGPALTAVATGVAAFVQFNSFSSALLVAGASLVIATIIGIFVTTWMTGRIAKMNATAVFVSLLFWGWLWGIWGVLLSIPIIVIVKVLCQHVERLHPIAELLSD